MPLDERLRSRIVSLIAWGDQVGPIRPQEDDPSGRLLIHKCVGWIASAMSVIETIFPTGSAYRVIADATANTSSTSRVGRLTELLRAILSDIDAGVVASIADQTRSQVFASVLEQAEHYLNANRVEVAGVMASVAFEHTIRRACDRREIYQAQVELDQLLIALGKCNAISGLRVQRARAATGLWTKATRAQWSKFDASEVEATIATTRDLIVTLLEGQA